MKKLMILPMILLSVCLQGSVGDPLDPSVNAIKHNSRGLWHARWGEYYAAIAEYKIAIGLNPESAATAVFYNNLGNVYKKTGQPDWAITCVENAIRLNPNCMRYYENLVEAFSLAGKLDEKEAYFKKATDVFFDESYYWLLLGLIQEKKNNYRGAIKSFQNYILLEPQIVLLSAVKNKVNEIIQKENETI